MKGISVLVVAFILVHVGSALATLTPLQFAYGNPVEVSAEGAIHRLELPLAAYRYSLRADLGDVRIFNAAGQELPHSLRGPAPVTRLATKPVPFFPLEGREEGEEGVRLQVRQDRNGTLLDLQTSKGTAEDHSRPAGYLIDLDEAGPVAAIDLFWQPGSLAGETSVDLAISEDLQRWRHVASRVVLADLEYQNRRIQQRRVPLGHLSGRYLRLSFAPGAKRFGLQNVQALIGSAPELASPVEWLHLEPSAATSQDRRELHFASDHQVPAQSARLVLPPGNNVVRGSIWSRATNSERWIRRCEGVYYRLETTAGWLTSEPCTFPATRAADWKLVLAEDGAAGPNEAPSLGLELGWRADELLFVSRGEPPYLLAYGHGGLAGEQEVQVREAVAMTVSAEAGRLVVAEATLGPVTELAGAEALRLPSPPFPWQTVLLWVALVAGVLLLGLMAWQLWRQMGNND